jgi:hypothetical protein
MSALALQHEAEMANTRLTTGDSDATQTWDSDATQTFIEGEEGEEESDEQAREPEWGVPRAEGEEEW